MLMPSLRLMLELLPPTVDMPPTVLLPPPTDAMVLIVPVTLLPPPTLLPVTAASMAGATCTKGRPMLRLMPDLPVPTIPAAVPPATSTEAPRAPEDSTAVPSTVLATSTAAEACTRGPLMLVTSTGTTDLLAVASRECTDPLPPTLLASTTNISIDMRQNYLFPILP